MEEILHTARTEGRIFAEAVMNFYSPVTDRLRAELAQDSVVSARLDYSQRSSKLDRLRAGERITSFDRALYGGVLTDLGCYVLHFAVNLFGAPKSWTPPPSSSARWTVRTCSRCTMTALT